jgi:hypothetical protein
MPLDLPPHLILPKPPALVMPARRGLLPLPAIGRSTHGLRWRKGMLEVVPLVGFGAGRGRIDLSFTDSTDDVTDLTNYSFATRAVGAAHANRWVVCGIMARSVTAGRTISSVTIGGITATNVVTATDPTGGTNLIAIYIAEVPTGTTATVAVNFSGSMSRCGIGLWRMVGAERPAIGYATATDIVFSGNVFSVTIDCPPDGVIIGVNYNQTSAATSSTTWAGITERFDALFSDGTSQHSYTGAHALFAGAQSGLTVSTTNAATQQSGALAVASWAPY